MVEDYERGLLASNLASYLKFWGLECCKRFLHFCCQSVYMDFVACVQVITNLVLENDMEQASEGGVL